MGQAAGSGRDCPSEVSGACREESTPRGPISKLPPTRLLASVVESLHVSGLLVIGDLDCKVPTLKASGFAPRFGCQTTQGQSVDLARLHSMIS